MIRFVSSVSPADFPAPPESPFRSWSRESVLTKRLVLAWRIH